MTRVVATLILPCEDNDRRPLTEVHAALKRELCRVFGGFTCVPCYGGWMDDGKYYEDRSFEYRVAMENTEDTNDVWHSIALRYGQRARQLAVYLTYPRASQVPVIADLSDHYGSERLTEVLDELEAA